MAKGIPVTTLTTRRLFWILGEKSTKSLSFIEINAHAQWFFDAVFGEADFLHACAELAEMNLIHRVYSPNSETRYKINKAGVESFKGLLALQHNPITEGSKQFIRNFLELASDDRDQTS